MGSRVPLRPPQSRIPIATLTALDQRLLEETLRLARQAGGIVEPDPLVGALVVDPATHEVVGHGYHATHGGPHAEPPAIADAGRSAGGATLYCNLEPCGYDAPEKRQPPCTSAIIEAGVRRVVIGQVDPHPRVDGRGIQRLREAGISVDLAPDPRPYWQVTAVFTTNMALRRPLLHVVTATSPRSRTTDPWHDVDIAPEALGGAPDAHSILTVCAHPDELQLPAGWNVDFLDGEPSEAWFRALEAAA